MNSTSAVQLIKMLTYILIPVVMAVFGLIGFLVYIIFKEKNKSKDNESESKNSSKKQTNSNNQDKQSIFNFMEFDTVTDNMIVQKDGNRFLMVIECQGINYDLMSGIEKNGVEEGFVQFLNTLRYPIQIYIQTRSINLESSLVGYREKLKEVEIKLRKMQSQYDQMRESGENLDKKEIEESAFSELYTRAQSLINSIGLCGVRGKILKSDELVELLYMAYNRDEAETFGLDKAVRAGYDEMYSTAPDVLAKRMKELDKIIESKAMNLASEKIEQAKSELEQKVEEKEHSMEELISKMAKIIIGENERYVGKEIADKAIEKVDEDSTNEGGKADGKKKTTRGRKKTRV